MYARMPKALKKSSFWYRQLKKEKQSFLNNVMRISGSHTTTSSCVPNNLPSTSNIPTNIPNVSESLDIGENSTMHSSCLTKQTVLVDDDFSITLLRALLRMLAFRAVPWISQVCVLLLMLTPRLTLKITCLV